MQATLQGLSGARSVVSKKTDSKFGRHGGFYTRCDAVSSVTTVNDSVQLDTKEIKKNILQLASLTDRGQRLNKTVSSAYSEEEERMNQLVETLAASQASEEFTESSLSGEWELVYANVELFRSSPFFLAVEEAFGEKAKSDLFFRLHLLQVGSWGASTLGRVAQRLDFEAGVMESEFDTILFGLTVIPIVGWFKLLPTVGGRINTVAKDFRLTEGNVLTMEVEKTQFLEVPGVEAGLLGKLLKEKWAPVSTVWPLLPWNWQKPPVCSITVKYVDDEMRIMEDKYGAIFVYMRPILP